MERGIKILNQAKSEAGRIVPNCPWDSEVIFRFILKTDVKTRTYCKARHVLKFLNSSLKSEKSCIAGLSKWLLCFPNLVPAFSQMGYMVSLEPKTISF